MEVTSESLSGVNPVGSADPAGTLVPLSIDAAIIFFEMLDGPCFRRQSKLLDEIKVIKGGAAWTWRDGHGGGDALDLISRASAFDRAWWAEKINEILKTLPAEDIAELMPRTAAQEAEDRRFPVHALTPILRDVVCDLADVHGVPAEFIAAFALAITGAAAGKGIALTTWRGMKVYPNLYVLAGLESGFGKSVVTKPLLAPFISYERELQAEHARECPKIEAELALIHKQIAKLTNAKAHDQ
jgi:hypothetical protein